MKLMSESKNYKRYEVDNGFWRTFIIFENEKLTLITHDISIPNKHGELTSFDKNDDSATLTAKWEGRDFTPITYCYCGNVKQLSGLNCKECTNWSRMQR